MKKAVSLILAVLLVCSMCVMGVSAADKTITPSATIGGQMAVSPDRTFL